MKKGNSRRSFIKNISLATSAFVLSGCDMKALNEFLQQNFKTLSKKEKDEIVKNLQIQYKEKYGREFNISYKPAIEGTSFGYALDLSKCIGCRRCVYACVNENNQSRNPQIHYIEVLQMEKEKGIDFAHSNAQYNPEKVPEKGHFYVPVQCQQCKNPPCVKVCPVIATWQEPDGITVVDYNWCIAWQPVRMMQGISIGASQMCLWKN
jgi:molybdopterin-containing oxidoreductase family iron-sulfur binding subunit